MTPEERSLLSEFLNDLSRTQGLVKDPEAARMIETAVRTNPDSAYVLVQHALLADQALHQAQARIAELEARGAAGAAPSSFLGAGLGPRYGQSSWTSAASSPAPGGGLFSGGGGLGNFLRSAGTTAAGVAGGELLFSGLSNLFGGHGGGYGGWGGPGENVTINNYEGGGGGWDDPGGDFDDQGGGDWS